MLRLLALLGGVALLVWRVRAARGAGVFAELAQFGAGGFAFVLISSMLRFSARSGAWIALLGGGVPLHRVVAATIAGDAAGQITPLGVLVSEPTKAAYLGRELGSSRALAALAAENFFYSVSVAIYVIIGAVAMLEAFPLEPSLQRVGIVALAVMAAVLAGAAWLAWQQPSVLSSAVGRIPIARLRATIDRVRDFEIATYGSVGGHSGRLTRVVAWHAVFHTLSFVEMWITLWFITGQSLPGAALVLDAFGRIANVAFKVIPLQLGVHQVGSEVVAAAVGLDPSVGLTSSFVRTARVLVWTIVGFGLLGRRGLRSKARGT